MNNFMQIETTQKGTLWTCDCAKCGTTLYAHEWASADPNEERDALQSGAYPCIDCGGQSDPDTFVETRNQYACRYSAPGYMDCTDWSFGGNRKTLERDVRAMYA